MFRDVFTVDLPGLPKHFGLDVEAPQGKILGVLGKLERVRFRHVADGGLAALLEAVFRCSGSGTAAPRGMNGPGGR